MCCDSILIEYCLSNILGQLELLIDHANIVYPTPSEVFADRVLNNYIN